MTNYLTYTEAGVVHTLTCAWCVEAGRAKPAVDLVITEKGTYPACRRHANQATSHGLSLVGGNENHAA